MFSGPVTIFGNDFADRLLREFAIEVDKGGCGSARPSLTWPITWRSISGATRSFSSDQDLGFSDGLAYARGPTSTKSGAELRPLLHGRDEAVGFIARYRHILRRLRIMRKTDVYRERLYTYLPTIRARLPAHQTRIIDATGRRVEEARGRTSMKLARGDSRILPGSASAAPPADGARASNGFGAGKCASRPAARREEARQIELISQDTRSRCWRKSGPRRCTRRASIERIAQIDTLPRPASTRSGATYDLVTQN